MAKMGRMLQEEGHDVHMVMTTPLLEKFTPEGISVLTYDLLPGQKVRFITDEDVLDEFRELHAHALGILHMPDLFASIAVPFCDALLSNTTLIDIMKGGDFDVVIIDIFMYCGRILLDYLDIPGVLYSNFGFYPMDDVFYPTLTSFVCDPLIGVCNKSSMTFVERTQNMLVNGLMNHVFTPRLLSHFQELRIRHGFNKSLSVTDSFKKAIVIANVDFVLDYPRPLMPHVIPIWGLYRKEPRPLPVDLLQFIADSPYDDIVVVSFGTLIPKIGSTKAGIIARVLAKLPAVVFWRFTGEPPRDLGQNTKLVGWFPQADVLSHPNTRLFLTHCGISSLYEAAQSGVPVVAIPMLADQKFNAEKLVGRGKMGLAVDFLELNEANFEKAVFSVFHNDTYLENAKRVSALLNDHPVPPREQLVYWIEYIMRHKGAGHLLSPHLHNMNVFQFYSVDVVLFLIGIGLLGMGLVVTGGAFLCRLCCRGAKKEKQQ